MRHAVGGQLDLFVQHIYVPAVVLDVMEPISGCLSLGSEATIEKTQTKLPHVAI